MDKESGAKLYCPHVLVDGNWHIWITEKMGRVLLGSVRPCYKLY